MSYSPLSYAQTSLQFEDVIAYIPPYGNYTQIPIGVLQDQYLALLFRSPVGQKAQHLVAMYNISKIKQTYNLSNQLNYNSTIQMEGGYYFNESFENILQIALVSQTNNISQFLLVLSKNETMNQTDVTLLVYNQSIYFQCSDVSQLSKNYDYYLVASNSFYNYNISITIQHEQLSNPTWAWILLVLTIIICTALVIEFWKKIKMQNLEQNKSTELLEIEM
ncbi:unnamed protein product [Paramecium primaurelia]|uniref:Transmembrane protein n=1 Tax=Paramecium primaurelia TaxID=5886 RepID=A0A8S1Q978_PARPR|nr:unnamed protein product [Paramecium primaurelia]